MLSGLGIKNSKRPTRTRNSNSRIFRQRDVQLSYCPRMLGLPSHVTIVSINSCEGRAHLLKPGIKRLYIQSSAEVPLSAFTVL